MNVTVSAVVGRKPRRTMLLLLAVLLLISYGLLTLLVVRQGRTIDSQRSLIHLSYKDRIDLSAMKPSASKNQAGASSQAPPNQIPLIRVPLTQVPSSNIPLIQVPSTQAPLIRVPPAQVPPVKSQANANSPRRSRKAQKRSPLRPPVEVTDPSDMRRVSFAI
jgi:hypothetical protein